MQTFTVGRGRKKAVQQFRNSQGLTILATITGVMIIVLLLFMLGILRVD